MLNWVEHGHCQQDCVECLFGGGDTLLLASCQAHFQRGVFYSTVASAGRPLPGEKPRRYRCHGARVGGPCNSVAAPSGKDELPANHIVLLLTVPYLA